MACACGLLKISENTGGIEAGVNALTAICERLAAAGIGDVEQATRK
jgi:hypothetical protein